MVFPAEVIASIIGCQCPPDPQRLVGTIALPKAPRGTQTDDSHFDGWSGVRCGYGPGVKQRDHCTRCEQKCDNRGLSQTINPMYMWGTSVEFAGCARGLRILGI